jgi:pyruvate kinase
MIATMRHTKIVATIGPKSDNDAVLDAMIAAGVDVVRLNFSHGTHETHERTYGRVRAAAKRAGRIVAVLQDLSGPKIRTGRLEGGLPIELRNGERLTISTGSALGRPGHVYTTFDGLAPSVRRGDRLLLADGVIELRVEGSEGGDITTVVVDGGMLGEHKGISAPGVDLPASAITAKDADDLRFGLSLGVDLVAVSFVQSAADLRRAREVAVEAGAPDVPLVAKLERPRAVERLDEILEACDAVMVARGDLGLELPLERVPRAQKEITAGARRRGVPVILATQVLESMTVESRPTRAEVSDAANAVADGVDAIMLSGDTAVGAFPSRTVQTLDAIIRDAEESVGASARGFAGIDVPHTTGDRDHESALCEAAVTLAERAGARAIVAVTRGGGTARRLAALRPRAPILATTNHEHTAPRLALLWGVLPVYTDIPAEGEAARQIGQELVSRGLLQQGSDAVFVSINPDLTRRDVNFLKIHRI